MEDIEGVVGLTTVLIIYLVRIQVSGVLAVSLPQCCNSTLSTEIFKGNRDALNKYYLLFSKCISLEKLT